MHFLTKKTASARIYIKNWETPVPADLNILKY